MEELKRLAEAVLRGQDITDWARDYIKRSQTPAQVQEETEKAEDLNTEEETEKAEDPEKPKTPKKKTIKYTYQK
jgi:hypothetical protein